MNAQGYKGETGSPPVCSQASYRQTSSLFHSRLVGQHPHSKDFNGVVDLNICITFSLFLILIAHYLPAHLTCGMAVDMPMALLSGSFQRAVMVFHWV